MSFFVFAKGQIHTANVLTTHAEPIVDVAAPVKTPFGYFFPIGGEESMSLLTLILHGPEYVVVGHNEPVWKAVVLDSHAKIVHSIARRSLGDKTRCAVNVVSTPITDLENFEYYRGYSTSAIQTLRNFREGSLDWSRFTEVLRDFARTTLSVPLVNYVSFSADAFFNGKDTFLPLSKSKLADCFVVSDPDEE